MKASLVATVTAALVVSGCTAPHDRTAGPGPSGPSPAASRAALGAPSGTALTSAVAAFRLPATLSRAVALPGPGGNVLVLGGLHDGERSTNAVLEINLRNESVRVLARLPTAVHDAAGAQLGGLPTALGGGSPDSRLAQQYDPTTASTHASSVLPVPVSDAFAARTDRGVLVMGGYDGTRTLDEIVLVTDAGRVQLLGHLAVPVRYAAVVTVGSGPSQHVLLFGGESGGLATDAVQDVDPATGRASVVAHLGRPRTQAAALVLDGQVYLLGGRSSGTSSATVFADVLRYDDAARALTSAGSLPYPVADAAAVSVDGHVGYLIGGETPARTSRTIVIQAA